MRILGYVRVSTEKQNDQTQQFAILNFAAGKNWSEEVEFLTETISGTVPYYERELGNEIKKLKEGDIIVVSELSRLGRTTGEILTLLNNLKEKKILVYAVKGGYQLNGNDISSKIITMMMALMAEIERDLVSLRTKEALARLKAEGKKVGRPQGSKSKKKKLDNYVEEMRKMLLRGVGLASVSRYFSVYYLKTVLFEDKVFKLKYLGLQTENEIKKEIKKDVKKLKRKVKNERLQ